MVAPDRAARRAAWLKSSCPTALDHAGGLVLSHAGYRVLDHDGQLVVRRAARWVEPLRLERSLA
jgi:hypothetical protein